MVMTESQLARFEKAVDKFAAAVQDLLTAPTNAYGENLVDGIQNAHERGMRGMNTHDRR